MRRRTDKERGVIAVEFAIVFPLLALIFFGIVQFGIAFSKYEVYTGAAREGARFAAVRCAPLRTNGCLPGDISNKVISAAAGYAITGTPTGSIVCSGSTVGQSVTVSWTQSIAISIPFWKNVTATPTISAVFRCE